MNNNHIPCYFPSFYRFLNQVRILIITMLTKINIQHILQQDSLTGKYRLRYKMQQMAIKQVITHINEA